MANLDYYLTCDNSLKIVERNHICFAGCREPIHAQKRRLEYANEAFGSNADHWKIKDIELDRTKFSFITTRCPVQYFSRAWFDFLVNLPVYKGKCSYKYVPCVEPNDKHSPFDAYRNSCRDAIASAKANHTGYVELTVSLNSLPVQMSFSLLSMVRYCRDYSNLVKAFDLMLSKGLHPYLSFVLAQQCERRSPFDEKKIRIISEISGACGHHSMRSYSAMSIDLLKIFYHEDYSGKDAAATLNSYAVTKGIPDSRIRFMEPGRSNKRTLEKKLRLVEDGVVVRGVEGKMDHYGSTIKRDYLMLDKLRVKDLNACIESMIAGKVSTEMPAPTGHHALANVRKSKKAIKAAKHTKKLNSSLIGVGAVRMQQHRNIIVGTRPDGTPILAPVTSMNTV